MGRSSSFIPRLRRMIASCLSSVAAARLSALASGTAFSSHSFSIRSKAAFGHHHGSFDVFGLLLLDPRLQICHELLRRKISGFSSRYFHSRFHFFYDLLPRCFNDGGILFPVLAGSLFEDRGTRESVFVS